jgi:hypothetical protein
MSNQMLPRACTTHLKDNEQINWNSFSDSDFKFGRGLPKYHLWIGFWKEPVSVVAVILDCKSNYKFKSTNLYFGFNMSNGF